MPTSTTPASDGPGVVRLRPVADADLGVIFEQMRDPEAVAMAAFTVADPDDRAQFDQRARQHAADPTIVERAVTLDERLVGTIASFVIEGDTELTYWIARDVWGRGVATRALALFLDEVTVRPLSARAASDNAGSLRVLEKVGFHRVGTDRGFANARGAVIEETLFRLD